MEQKECAKCYDRQPIENFTPHYQYWDDREGTCKKCRKMLKVKFSAIQQRTYRLTHYPYNQKACSACKELLTLSKFCKKRKHRDGLSYECRPCSKIKNVPFLPQYTKDKLENERRVLEGLEPIIKKRTKGVLFSM
ncbi:MAG: hypothetical protein DRR06_19995 [Gammaproteobacteria bacterium]|nr:MAG: hypothetical protein DRR06_19995 [Gammaproteobacteria bacterium]